MTGGNRPGAGWIASYRWLDGIIRHARWVVAAAVLATLLAGWFASKNLGMNTDTADMLSPQLPFRAAYEEYKRAFPQFVDTLLVVIEGDTPESASRAADALTTRLKADDKRFISVYRPGSGAFFERNGLLYLSVAELQQLSENLARAQPFLAKLTADQSLAGLLGMVRLAVNEAGKGEAVDIGPLLGEVNKGIEASLANRPYRLSWRELMRGGAPDPEQRRQFVIVQPRLDFSTLLAGQPAMEAVRQTARELGIDEAHGLRMRLTGSVPLATEELESVTQGAGMASALSLLTVLVALAFAYRSLRMVWITLVTLLIGLVWNAAFAAAVVGHLNLISVAFAVMYIGLGVDYAIYLCLRYQELAARNGPGPETLRDAVRDNGLPLLLCAVTTATGFYSFIPTVYSGVSELGLIAGTGMFISMLLTLTLIPALLTVWPPAARIRQVPKRRVPEAVATFPLRHTRGIRWAALLLALAGLLALPKVRFDYNPLNLRNPNSESVATLRDLLAKSPAPPWSVTVLAADPAQARAVADRLKQLPAVGRVVALESYVPGDQEEKLPIVEDIALLLGPQLSAAGAPPPSLDRQRQAIDETIRALDGYLAQPSKAPWADGAARLRANLARLAGALKAAPPQEQQRRLDGLQDSLLGNLPASLELLKTSLSPGRVQLSDLPPDLVSRYVAADGTRRVDAYPKENIDDNDALRRFVTSVQSVAPNATDGPVLYLAAGDAIVSAFLQAFGIALAATVVVLTVVLRRFVDMLMVLTPLLLSVLLTVAAMVLMKMPFNFANVIALPLLIGTGVENGIYLVYRTRQQAQLSDDLLRSATARAMFYTAGTTILSFGNLAFSPHTASASMGLILIIGLLLTLAGTFTVLPALLVLKNRRPLMPSAHEPKTLG